MQFETQPLSPSAFSFINTDMLLNDDDSSSMQQQQGSSIDLFKYYLDMTSAQQKEQQQQQLPSYQPSMHDIEGFHSLLNSANNYQQQSNASLYPFADATNTSIDPSSTTTSSSVPYSFNPTAFSPLAIPSGSDLPIDPRYTSLPPQEQQQSDAQTQQQQPTATNAPITRIRVKSEALEQELPAPAPAPTARRAAKKRAVSELIIEEVSEEDEEDDDEEDSEAEHAPRKSARRSTASSSKKSNSVASKATAATKKTVTSTSNVSHPHALVPVPDYIDRPSKEEYEKLSSKEKRQLRNKISARNFRHRRKAHIDTLEEQIAGKDQIIDGLREEVGTLRSENQGLRADIDMLKKNWESIAAKISASTAPVASTSSASLTPDEEDLYGAGSLPALSPASSSASTNGDAESLFDTAASTSTAPSSTQQQQRRVSTRSSNAKSNVRKDISPSTGGSFWDTSASPFAGGFGAGGRAMDVHTTFVPEININSPAASFNSPSSASSLLAGKREKDINPSSHAFAYGGNMNPALNGLNEAQINFLRDQFVSSAAATAAAANNNNAQQKKSTSDPVSDSFFETNPFLLLRNDSLQDYRGQLYSKLAHNVAGIQATQQAQKSGKALPAGLRPAFLSSPSFTSVSVDPVQESERVAKHVGALATKTLFEKLSTAFWDAFAGEQPATRSMVPVNNKKSVDGQKVADVVGGKSKLVVVPVIVNEKDEGLDRLSSQLNKLDLAKKA